MGTELWAWVEGCQGRPSRGKLFPSPVLYETCQRRQKKEQPWPSCEHGSKGVKEDPVVENSSLVPCSTKQVNGDKKKNNHDDGGEAQWRYSRDMREKAIEKDEIVWEEWGR
jgi:hypothetical protein